MSSEEVNQQQARLIMSRIMGHAWRNNSGAYLDDNGSMVRYGLCNDSAQLNAHTKSSDLIGITPTLITQQMVGYHLGVFTALEIKPSGWKLRPSDKRGNAQANFHRIVREACGFAGFVTDPATDIPQIIGRSI